MRTLVKWFAGVMEARFVQKDGTERCNRPVADDTLLALAMLDAARAAATNVAVGDMEQATKKTVDVANFAAILMASLSLPDQSFGDFEDFTCESGCEAPVAVFDREGVPMCRDCYLGSMLEPEED